MLEINKIYNMDCLEGMKQMENGSVDLIITDPPYNTGMNQNNTGGRFGSNKKINNDRNDRLGNFFNDSYPQEEYERLVELWTQEMFRVLKDNHMGYIFMSWKQTDLWIKCLKKAGFRVKNIIVWDKVIHGLNYQNYCYTHEFIIFFKKGECFPNNKDGTYYKDVWNIPREIDNDKESEHETVKPLTVVRPCVLHGSKEQELVLDMFMGSGTTAVACKQLNRNFIGFETEQKYIKIAEKRLEQKTLIKEDWFK